MKKLFAFILLALAGLTTIPNEAHAYWHGRAWGAGGAYHPGWGCGWRCGGQPHQRTGSGDWAPTG